MKNRLESLANKHQWTIYYMNLNINIQIFLQILILLKI